MLIGSPARTTSAESTTRSLGLSPFAWPSTCSGPSTAIPMAPTVDLIPIPVNGTVTTLTPLRRQPNTTMPHKWVAEANQSRGAHHDPTSSYRPSAGRARSNRADTRRLQCRPGTPRRRARRRDDLAIADPHPPLRIHARDEPTFTPAPGEVMTLPFGANGWATMRQGRYAVHVTPTLGYQVDVPDNWRALSGRFLSTPVESASVFHVAPALRNHTRLPAHPCRDHATRLVGPTVSHLARALRRQAVLKVTKPLPVTLGGRQGLYVKVTVPDNVDPSTCVEGSVTLFEGGDEAEDDGWVGDAGYVGHWWILDVHGERIVVMPQCDISCPAQDFDTLTTMAESITFTRGQAATQAGAIPSSVYAVPGKGGLRLEKDLAIGRASVALANPTGAFVISAGDGVYHRLALPGYDARLYNHQRPGLALSPDGWKLAYAWHGPTRLMNPGESYDGLIQAKFRLVDLRTGRISPIEPHVPGLRSPLAWLAWNPRWSPDSRFVVSDLTLTFGDDNGIKTDWYEHNSESESSVQRLDASQERTWTAKGRFEYTGIDKPYGSVPIVKSSGGGAAVDEDGKLHTWRPDGKRRDVTHGYAAWSAGRFSADGSWLLLQPRGLGDSLLAVDRATSTTIELPLLDATEWPEGAAIDLLGWVGTEYALAILRRGAGAEGATPDADLVLISLDLAGASADFTVVGKVNEGRSKSAFSFATDLASVQSPTRELVPPSFRQ